MLSKTCKNEKCGLTKVNNVLFKFNEIFIIYDHNYLKNNIAKIVLLCLMNNISYKIN